MMVSTVRSLHWNMLGFLAVATLVVAHGHGTALETTLITTSLSSTAAAAVATGSQLAIEEDESGEAASAEAGSDTLDDSPRYAMVIAAHGIMGVLAFAIMFPAGGMMVRLLKKGIWKHAGCMALAWALALATLGTGIHIAKGKGSMGESHAILGVIVVAGLGLQPVSGYLHHILFIRTGGRTAMSYLHMCLGAPLITAGTVNGVLGLRLAHETFVVQAAYAIVALIIWAGWMAATIFAARKRSHGATEAEPTEKTEDGLVSHSETNPATLSAFDAYYNSYPPPVQPLQPTYIPYVPYIPPATGALPAPYYANQV